MSSIALAAEEQMTQIQKENLNFQNPDKNYQTGATKGSLYLAYANRGLLLVILTIGLYHVFNINNLAVKGFVLREVKTEYNALIEENKKAEIEIMAGESLENIEARANQLKMVKADKIAYLKAKANEVAMR